MVPLESEMPLSQSAQKRKRAVSDANTDPKIPKFENPADNNFYTQLKDESVSWKNRLELAAELWDQKSQKEREQIFHCLATGLMKKKSSQLSTADILMLWQAVRNMLKSCDVACNPKPSFIASIAHFLTLTKGNRPLLPLLLECLGLIALSERESTRSLVLEELDVQLDLLEKIMICCEAEDEKPASMDRSIIPMIDSIARIGAKRANHKKLPTSVANLIPKFISFAGQKPESKELLESVKGLLGKITFRQKDSDKYHQFLAGKIPSTQLFLFASVQQSVQLISPDAIKSFVKCVMESFVRSYGSQARQGILLSQRIIEMFETHPKLKNEVLEAVLEQIADLDLFASFSDPDGQDLAWLKSLFQDLITSEKKSAHLYKCLKAFISIEPGLIRKNIDPLLSLCQWNGKQDDAGEEDFKAALVSAMGQQKQTQLIIDSILKSSSSKKFSSKVEDAMAGVIEPLTSKQIRDLLEKLMLLAEDTGKESAPTVQMIRIVVSSSNFLRSPAVVTVDLLQRLTSLHKNFACKENTAISEDMRIVSMACLALSRYHIGKEESFAEVAEHLLEASKPAGSDHDKSTFLWLSGAVSLKIGKAKKHQKFYKTCLSAASANPDLWNDLLSLFPILPMSLGEESCMEFSKHLVSQIMSDSPPQPIVGFFESKKPWDCLLLQQCVVRAFLESISLDLEENSSETASMVTIFKDIPQIKFEHYWRKSFRQLLDMKPPESRKISAANACKALKVLHGFCDCLSVRESARLFGAAFSIYINHIDDSNAKDIIRASTVIMKELTSLGHFEIIFDEKTWNPFMQKVFDTLKPSSVTANNRQDLTALLCCFMEFSHKNRFTKIFSEAPDLFMKPAESLPDGTDASAGTHIAILLSKASTLSIQASSTEISTALKKFAEKLNLHLNQLWKSLIKPRTDDGPAFLHCTSATINCFTLFGKASMGYPTSAEFLEGAVDQILACCNPEWIASQTASDVDLLGSIATWLSKNADSVSLQKRIGSGKVLEISVMDAKMKSDQQRDNSKLFSKWFTDATVSEITSLLEKTDRDLRSPGRIKLRSALLELVMEGKLAPIVRTAISADLMKFLAQMSSTTSTEYAYESTMKLFRLVLQLKGDILNFGIKGREVLPTLLTWTASQDRPSETHIQLCIQFLNDCLLHQPHASIQMSSIFLGLFRQCIRDLFSLSKTRKTGDTLRCYYFVSRFCLLLKGFQKEVEKVTPYLLAELMSGIQEWNPSVKERAALLPGIHALLDICSDHSLTFLASSLPPASQHLLKSTMDIYSKYYKFRGNV